MTTRKGHHIPADTAHQYNIRPMFKEHSEARAWDAGYACGVLDTVKNIGADEATIERCALQLARLVTPEVDCG